MCRDWLTFSCVKSLIFVDIAWSQSVLSAAVQNWRILALAPSKAKTSKQLDLEEGIEVRIRQERSRRLEDILDKVRLELLVTLRDKTLSAKTCTALPAVELLYGLLTPSYKNIFTKDTLEKYFMSPETSWEWWSYVWQYFSNHILSVVRLQLFLQFNVSIR